MYLKHARKLSEKSSCSEAVNLRLLRFFLADNPEFAGGGRGPRSNPRAMQSIQKITIFDFQSEFTPDSELTSAEVDNSL
jgi:hypothetical protein